MGTDCLNIVLYWDCIGDCIGAVLGLYWDCIGIVLGLYWDCIGIVLGLYWDCIGIVSGREFLGLHPN